MTPEPQPQPAAPASSEAYFAKQDAFISYVQEHVNPAREKEGLDTASSGLAARLYAIARQEFERELTASRALVAKLAFALRDTTDECMQFLKDTGDCDHSVGICCCELKWRIERATAALALTEGQCADRIAELEDELRARHSGVTASVAIATQNLEMRAELAKLSRWADDPDYRAMTSGELQHQAQQLAAKDAEIAELKARLNLLPE